MRRWVIQMVKAVNINELQPTVEHISETLVAEADLRSITRDELDM